MLLGILLLLCERVSANCSHVITGGLGLRTFRAHLTDPNDEICINISIFPFFIVFGEMPGDMEYIEYRSFNDTSRLDFYKSGIGELLPSFQVINLPFASVTLRCPSCGVVSFSYGSVQSICKTGIFFTNFRNSMIDLSSSFQSEKSLAQNEDKCIVFTARNVQRFHMFFALSGCLIVYNGTFDFIKLTGEDEFDFQFNMSNETPSIFRILTGESIMEERFSISIENESPKPFNEFTSFYDPINRSEANCPPNKPCNVLDLIDLELIGIITAFSIASLIVFAALFYVLSITFCPSLFRKNRTISSLPSKDDPKSLSTENLVAEKTVEPKGYFAMDPILRPPDEGKY